ncbi:hypothetical protein CDAR_89131 [Caerostris darwini]|uniref:Uncharacterized protein n=1 Tax=Caerostris darwini TaxID=1538125 RepID=A0AAV4W9U3_9ARAC|nr:hypothetical protein CDAR_89131 [Caerostris darwini]
MGCWYEANKTSQSSTSEQSRWSQLVSVRRHLASAPAFGTKACVKPANWPSCRSSSTYFNFNLQNSRTFKAVKITFKKCLQFRFTKPALIELSN